MTLLQKITLTALSIFLLMQVLVNNWIASRSVAGPIIRIDLLMLPMLVVLVIYSLVRFFSKKKEQRSRTFLYLLSLLVVGLFFTLGSGLGWFGFQKGQIEQKKLESEKVEKKEDLSLTRYFGEKKCYLKKTSVPAGPWREGEFNYDFIDFTIDKENQVQGVVRYYPYGTDSGIGSLFGEFNPETRTLKGVASLYGEGSHYTSPYKYTLLDNGDLRVHYLDTKGGGETLPAIGCDDYQKEYTDYLKKYFNDFFETQDTSLIEKMNIIKEQNLSAEDLAATRFIQREIDLDNDYKTKEYLVYLMGSYYCGSGGCHLYVVNESGKTISSSSVTKLPVYVEIKDIEKVQKGEWDTLYVWSDGSFREMKPGLNGRYPSNPSLQKEVSVAEIEGHPEKYYMIMNYLN